MPMSLTLARATLFAAASAFALTCAFSACATRRDFPEPAVGWHSPTFSTVFGRLEKLPGATPDAAPVWTLRFGTTQASYQGRLALTPPERLVGYSGNERVEIHGHVLDQPTTDAFNGRWYVVDSIQMWSEYR
jgi:hypothetical protein